MKNKKTVRTNWNRVNFLLFILMLLSAYAAMQWQQQMVGQQQKDDEQKYQQQIFSSANIFINSRVKNWQQLLTTITEQAKQVNLLTASEDLRLDWQTKMHSVSPEVSHLCFFSSVPSKPINTACLNINFAVLDVLRTVEKGEKARVVVVKNDNETNLLFAQALTMSESENGIVVMAVSVDKLNADLKQMIPSSGYLEITQGESFVVAKYGNPALKTVTPMDKQLIPTSSLELKYWHSPAPLPSNLLMLIVFAVIVTLFWLLQNLWLKRMHKQDAEMITSALSDFEQGSLKTHYPLNMKVFNEVNDTIQRIAIVAGKKSIESARVESVAMPEIKHDSVQEMDSPTEVVRQATESQATIEVNEMSPEQLDPALQAEYASVSNPQQVEPVSTTKPKSDSMPTELDELNALAVEPEAPDSEPVIKINPEVEESSVIEFETSKPDDAPLILPIESDDESNDIKEKAVTPDSLTLAIEPNHDSLILPLEEDDVDDEKVEIDQSIFRANDIRGLVGEQLNPDTMRVLGKAVGELALNRKNDHFIVGRDGRLSSKALSDAFIRGLLSTGCHVTDIGAVPTPLVYFACEELETHTGAMITGSHNPADYNGVKLIIDATVLSKVDFKEIRSALKTREFPKGHGRLEQRDITDEYLSRIKVDIHVKRSMKVIVDCGNGIAGNIVPKLLEELGCEVKPLFCEVDGAFPNHHPDPAKPENLQVLISQVKNSRADLGIAYDGDGDRLTVIDGAGNIIWGDKLLLFFVQHVLIEHPDAAIAYDVKSTSLLGDEIAKAGGRPMMSPSGHSKIKNLMAKHDVKLAGEFSGHIFFRDDRWYGFDDALYATARLLELLAAYPEEKTPTKIFAELSKRVSTPEIFVDMPQADSEQLVKKFAEIIDFDQTNVTTLDGVRVDFTYGWGLVRCSNTMPGLTMRFEGINQEALKVVQKRFAAHMKKIDPAVAGKMMI